MDKVKGMFISIQIAPLSHHIYMKQRRSGLPLPNIRQASSLTDTFTSSQQEKEQRFALDRSLARAINQYDSSIIVGQHPQSMGMQLQQGQDYEQEQSVLFEYRHKYDRIKTQAQQLDKKVQKEKEELRILQEQYAALTGHKKHAESSFVNTGQDLGNLSQNVDQLQLNFDIGKAMEERLKADIIFYKMKTYDLNMQLMKKRSQIKRHSTQSTRVKRLSFRCKTLLSSIQQTVSSNVADRGQKLSFVKNQLVTRHQRYWRNQSRAGDLQRSMVAVMSEKLPQEKMHQELFYANIFLKKLLHQKMEAIMQKYRQISSAFNQIKTNTTVKTVDQFILKFLNKNQIYGELLQSVSKLQPKIDDLEEERRVLQEECRRLEAQGGEIEEELRDGRHEQSLEKCVGEMSAVNIRLQVINKLTNAWTNWSHTTIAMFRTVPRIQVKKQYNSLLSLLENTLNMLLTYLSSQSEPPAISLTEQALQKQTGKGKSQGEVLVRNIRVKTMNDSGVQQQQEYDLMSQKDYLHHARRSVKKSSHNRSKN